jgi:monolysocardiolipin acyltransferase
MDFDDYRSEATLARRVIARLCMAGSKLLLERLNRLDVERAYQLHRALAQGRGLITFSNHVSLFDDPWLPATIADGPWESLRWCATDDANFFTHPVSRWFFSAGKGVPIVRGAGLDQPGMHFLADRLREGDWVHIFPEGGRSRTPHQLRTPLKKGMAHLVRDTRPLMLPYHHWGMEKVLPIGASWPSTGQRVQLRFGELTDSDRGLADRSVDEITTWAEEQLLALQAEAEAASGRESRRQG